MPPGLIRARAAISGLAPRTTLPGPRICRGSAPADEATIAGLAPDVGGLPPAFLAVGELDLFVHDNLAYVGRLLAAGCPVEAHLYPGAIHGFDRAVDAAVTLRYTRDLVAFVLRHLG